MKWIKQLDKKIINDEQWEKINESSDVVTLENNGFSGVYPNLIWWTATLTTGEEITLYTEF